MSAVAPASAGAGGARTGSASAEAGRAGGASRARHWAALLGLLALLAAAGLARPLLPVDETRYAAVAWEMWARGDFLLPVINGQPYHHKPPLLFWLMHAGWAVFGVNGWWPRLIAPLFAAGTLALTALLARSLWPARSELPRMAAAVLLASLLFAYFASALMFDVLLTFFVTLGLLGLVRAWRSGGAAGGFALLALGLTGALFSKGPVALVHLLPAVLLARWWMPAERPGGHRRPPWRRWVLGCWAALAVATLLILAWALPAAQAGGPAYRDAIFWGQSAGRMADSFAHRAPWYFYLVALPLLLAPWLLWPRWWQGMAQSLRGDAGSRLALCSLLSVLLLFSLFSGKRWHYLLPQFPLFALLVARAVSLRPAAGRWAQLVPALTLVVLGACAMLLVPRLAAGLAGVDDAAALHAGGAVAALAGLALAALRPATPATDVLRVATASVLATTALLVAVDVAVRKPYDLRPTARRLAQYEHEGRPVAITGSYHGQWTLAGRLRRPLDEIDPSQALAWLAAHPQGRVLFIHRQPAELPPAAHVEDLRNYRGGWLAVLAP